MDPVNFINAYSISDATPQRINKTVYTAISFALGTKEFIEENFRGLADVECEVSSNLSIMISPEFVAYFFKKLLSFIYGKTFVKIRFFTDYTRLNLEITSHSPLPIARHDMNELVRQARNAGFDVYAADRSISITTPILKEAALTVYALPTDLGTRTIKQCFDSIFFYDPKDGV